MAHTQDFDRYVAACDYPGVISPDVVAAALRDYLAALGVQREVRRLDGDWDLETEEPLRRAVGVVLDDFARRWQKSAARAARDALAASNAIAARAALAASNAIAALDARAASNAIDARAARDASNARAARAALAASDARAASNAIDARAARDARDAIDARAARDASNAIAARAARAASDARDAIDARAARAASNAIAALDARAASNAIAALDARAARDAIDALDARKSGALHRFASWCVHRGSWWWSWDLSWIATTLIGAQQLGTTIPWAAPLFEAYVAGAWMVFWTEDTLYWIAKPVVHVEQIDGRRRLHAEDGPAIESDLENLYFWHGVLVPAFVIVRPDWITSRHILDEENAEVRRVMLARYGEGKYITDLGAKPIHEDAYGVLYQVDVPGDEPLVMVRVVNATADADGSVKPYWLRVDPRLRPMQADGSFGAAQDMTASNAVASTFGLTGAEYAPAVET